jgi:putative PIN family toxin of toxin-antitoxin system
VPSSVPSAMRLVLDTNVVIAAVMGEGPPSRLIELAAEGSIDLVSSDTLIAELADVLSREHIARRLARKGRSAAEVLALYEDLVERIVPAEIARTVSDPDDDAVLACALAAGADLIVSGDKAVRNVKSFHRIPILHAGEALARITTG